MTNVPGLNLDVSFGDPDQPAPDWRALRSDEDQAEEEGDELTPEERADLVGLLGFDPAEETTPEPYRKHIGRYQRDTGQD